MIGRDRQTVADMAVEHCGNADAMFAIARRNGIAIDKETMGIELVDEPVSNRRTVEHIQGQMLTPANVYKADPDVLTNDPQDVALIENVETESNETIIQ